MNIQMNFFHRLALSTLSSLLVLGASVSYADDTEIFFGGPAIDDGVRPNVLFILDNSGSMAWRTDSNNNPSRGEESRMQILKRSFSTIINNAGPINAGIMVLNSRSAYNNTRMVYPVTNIDTPLPGSVQQVASTPEILVSGDDATQRIDTPNNAVINENVLLMGYVGATTATPLRPGKLLEDTDAFLRVRDDGDEYACRLNVPSNRSSNSVCENSSTNNINIRGNDSSDTSNPVRGTALLYFREIRDLNGNQLPASAANDAGMRAYLELRPTNTQSTAPTIEVQIEDSKTPAALNDSSQIGDSRDYLNTTNIKASSWNSSQVARIEITSLVKQVLAAAPTSNPLDSLFIRLRATTNSDYTFCARNCGTSNADAPRVVIDYTTPATEAQTRMGGLRFQNVGIPRGATITRAHLSFAPATTNTDPVSFEVKAEKVGDASVFASTSSLSGRTPKTTAMTTWAAPNWANVSPPVHVEGPDVTTLVQEVVNLGDWCGNNAMAFYLTPTSGTGSRTAYSLDGAPGLQPTLTVEYTGDTSGCLNPILEASVASPKDDAFEDNDGDMSLGGTTLRVDESRFAARYDKIPINRNATILDAQVILTPANTVSGANVTTTVRFEDADNSAAFSSSDDDISDRDDTDDSSCVLNSWITGVPVICRGPQLRTGLQSIVNRSGWTPGNAISVMSVQSDDTDLNVQAYESNPAQSVKLRIKVAYGGISNNTYTVRQHLNALVQAMNADDSTPIVPTYYEAAQYLAGDRSGFNSPITSACQSTHIVLLTDGQANSNSDSAKSGIGTMTNASCTGDASDDGERCGRTLATWMANTDQSDFDGNNFITTHTIGFALGALAPNLGPQNFMTDLATNGKGKSYTAQNASELSAAFSQILQDVLDTDTTFVSPGATVNQFNRESNKNEVYFALFKPSETNRWVGNVKRYALNDSAGSIILDADGVGAINASTGFFEDTARSFWTPVSDPDGNDTAKGGAANRLTDPTTRNLFTFIGNSPTSVVSLANDIYRLRDANTAITADMLGAANTTERTELINWIRGLNADGSVRRAMGDPLHSVPRLVTYACEQFTDSSLTSCANEDQSVFLGTNEGFVHALNTDTGDEQFGFMPEELLPNIRDLKANAPSSSLAPRKYGMDNTVTIWANDVNRNGVIYGGRDPSSTSTPPAQLSGLNQGEFVYAYATMGRGGRSLYALDVTNRSSPGLLWYKTKNSSGFSRLGQTWSTPVVTKVNVGGTPTPVLIFAGGYDPDQDNVNVRTPDSEGNALYIVNAVTGELIWSASNDASNAGASGHLQLNKMLYSIPSGVRVIDLDRDGMADQMFVADMGGQVWRFFINNGSAPTSLVSPVNSAASTADAGVFASVVPADTGSENAAQLKSKLRRFYNEPDAALLNVNGTKTLVINIGSGYRGHPLDKGTEDRFYSFRTPLVSTNSAHSVLTESSLYDATLNLVQEGSTSEKANAASQFATSTGGWYIRLTNAGEKVLADATTFAGKVFFNTYEPTAASDSCRAVAGLGRSYAVNLYDATPIEQRISGTPTRVDRAKALLTGGIPPKLITLFPEGKPTAASCIGTECEDLEDDITVGPTYWINEI
ncbi:pilus assembly protein [Pseudomonas sp. D(2018)]|uniref:pilus assembly protein n=1 Tax=Pseudomonas sp. D(2018) TaxID=2502238 RepID=UPI0010FA48C6|nr:PilC/PilY family type IV pilus protein [Pseudomonas sp. D(2018)]